MKQTLRWLLVSVAAYAICSLVTYRIAYHRGYEAGYKNGAIGGIRQGTFGQTLSFFAALQQLRAGDVPRATRFMETACFTSAQTYYKDPIPTSGEASEWGRALGLGRWPDGDVAKELAKELSGYRATSRTNSADWDDKERKLETQLAKIK